MVFALAVILTFACLIVLITLVIASIRHGWSSSDYMHGSGGYYSDPSNSDVGGWDATDYISSDDRD